MDSSWLNKWILMICVDLSPWVHMVHGDVSGMSWNKKWTKKLGQWNHPGISGGNFSRIFTWNILRLCKHSKLQRIHLPLKELDSSLPGNGNAFLGVNNRGRSCNKHTFSWAWDPKMGGKLLAERISKKGVFHLVKGTTDYYRIYNIILLLLLLLLHMQIFSHDKERWPFSAGKGRNYYKSYQIYRVACIMLSHWAFAHVCEISVPIHPKTAGWNLENKGHMFWSLIFSYIHSEENIKKKRITLCFFMFFCWLILFSRSCQVKTRHWQYV